MRHFEIKKNVKTKLYSKGMLIFLVLITVILLKAIGNIYIKMRESSNLRDEAEHKLTSLLERKEDLGEEMLKLENSEGVEKEIRTKFNVTKPGETMVLIVSEEKQVESFVENDWFSKFSSWFK